MKTTQLCILVTISSLLSCTNIKTNTSNIEKILDTTGIDTIKRPSIKRNEASLDSLNYYFSNDTLSQILNIKILSMSKEYEIPENVQFRFVLRDKLKIYSEKIFNGVAVLTSPNESYLDKSKYNEGSYLAADYNFSTSDYNINIRLDIETYEACVATLESDHLEKILMGLEKYIKKYPNYDIMRKLD